MSRKVPMDVNGIMLYAGIAFLYLPLAWLVLNSLLVTGADGGWGGFSMSVFQQTLGSKQIIHAGLKSLGIAALSATVAAVLGLLAGLSLVRLAGAVPGHIFRVLVAIPVVLPEIIVGISLFVLFSVFEPVTGLLSMHGSVAVGLAHTIIGTAFVALFMGYRLSHTGSVFEDAAVDLGAGRGAAFFLVTLPVIAPALAIGWLLVFFMSLNDVVITSIVSGAENITLPTVTRSILRDGAVAAVSAIGSLLALVAAAAAWLAWYLLRRTIQ